MKKKNQKTLHFGGGVTSEGYSRHIEACRNARLPGARVAFLLMDTPVGWVMPDLARRLLDFAPLTVGSPAAIRLTDPAGLADIAAALAKEGWFANRGEAFDVRGMDGVVHAQIDRGALPAFGIEACGVHLNGLVRRADGLHVWVGRRAMDRPLDPGKLDHLVAGGVPAGLSPWQTLLKEAQEEAGLTPTVTAGANPVGEIRYAMERPEGLRRDRLCCYDLFLPEDFVPTPQDNEIAGFELWPIARLMDRVAATDDFKFNVNLVLIDLFLRNGLADPGGRLRSKLDAID